jgi:hypothetical protein
VKLQAPFVHDCVNNGDLPPVVCRAPASERVAAGVANAESRGSMTDKADHIVWAAEAVALFQKHSRSGDEHAIADLICDLGHLADDLGFDFLSEIKRGIGHWYAEQHHLGDGDVLGPGAAVEIIIKPK